jgi:hypothetical protein
VTASPGPDGAAARAPARLSALLLIALGAALLAAPIVLNGAPFLLSDSDFYEFSGQIALGRFAHAIGLADALALTDAAARHASLIVGARSLYYGLIVAVFENVGTLWAIVAVHAVLCAWIVALTLRTAYAAPPRVLYLAIVAVLALATPLSLFVGFIMPDVFAGLAILCAALLIAFRERLARAAQAGLLVLFTVALTAHFSHFLTMLVLVAGAAAFAAWRGDKSLLRATRAPAVALAVAAAASALGLHALQLGPYAPQTPPFLTARLLEAGPGRAKLNDICAETAYAICAFRDRPLDKSADILWSDDPKTGVFSAARYAVKRRLVEQDRAFALDVFRRAPLSTIATALAAGVVQFTAVGVDPELRADAARWFTLPPQQFVRYALARIGACAPGRSCKPRLPLSILSVVYIAGYALALGFLALQALSLRRDPSAAPERAFLAFAALIVAGVALNALVCGAFSGVYPRYQARVAWLIPFLAILWAIHRPDRWPTKLRPLLPR